MPIYPDTGGSTPQPGLNGAQIFVAPSGSDSNDGTSWSLAKQTAYAGYARLYALGGGVLNIAADCDVGGPVAGQGLWLRGDDATITGWQPTIQCTINLVAGNAPPQLFANPDQGWLKGGSNTASDFRRKPSIWVCADDFHLIRFNNIRPVPAAGHLGNSDLGSFRTWRMGWDYTRSSDGSIKEITVTGSSRTAHVTTHTVTLPAGVAATTAQRTSNIVTLTIPRPAGEAKAPPWNVGTKFYWASNDEANFPSGAHTVITSTSFLSGTTDWSITYADTGTDHTSSTPGSVKSIVTGVGEYIDLESTDALFQSTQYKVTATSITNSTTGTITCTDPWNATTNTATNTGVIICQERAYNQLLAPYLYNCSGYSPQPSGAVAQYQTGPTFDFGSVTAIPPTLDSCFLTGYYPASGSGVVYDDDRSVAVFAYGGVSGASALKMVNCTGTQTAIRFIGGTIGGSVEIDGVFDSPNGEPPPPYHFTLNSSNSVDIVRCEVADDFSNTGIPVVDGSYDPLKVLGTGFPGSCVGPSRNPIGTYLNWVAGLDPHSQPILQTPWAQGQVGTWALNRITGRHPAGNRQISPTMARFKNLIDAPSAWTQNAGTLSTGIADPMGGTAAVRLADSGGAGCNITVRASATDASNTYAVGGKFIIGAWVRAYSNDLDVTRVFSFVCATSGLAWVNSGLSSWTAQSDANIDGWQFVYSADTISAISGQPTFSIKLYGPEPTSGGNVDMFAPCALYIPDTLNQNDVSEYFGTLRAQPQYLQPGMAGTFESQKFIAHGGSGIATDITKVVGGGAGQLTLTGTGTVYEPRYGADGTTILGWVALLQATVN